MKISNTSLVCFVLAFLTMSFGCGPKLPEGMPKLHPCTLTITQEGQPLEGALVALMSNDSTLAKWAPSGVTDTSGKVVLKTQGKYDGAAAGEYKVIVTKEVVEKGVVLQEETATTPERSIPGKTFSYVEKQYGDVQKTPLTLKIEGKTNETFDAGKAVKEEIISN